MIQRLTPTRITSMPAIFPNFSGSTLAEAPVEMCQPRERARRICKATAMAALAMTEMAEDRLVRLESDVAHIQSDVADLKDDVREIRKELGGVRDEMRKDLGGFRDETRKNHDGLRDEMRKEFAELHKELAANSKAIIRGDLMNRIWMLLTCAAMLGVIARGLHWL